MFLAVWRSQSAVRKKEADTERSKGKGRRVLLASRCLVASVPETQLYLCLPAGWQFTHFLETVSKNTLTFLKLIQVRLLLVKSKSLSQY